MSDYSCLLLGWHNQLVYWQNKLICWLCLVSTLISSISLILSAAVGLVRECHLRNRAMDDVVFCLRANTLVRSRDVTPWKNLISDSVERYKGRRSWGLHCWIVSHGHLSLTMLNLRIIRPWPCLILDLDGEADQSHLLHASRISWPCWCCCC